MFNIEFSEAPNHELLFMPVGLEKSSRPKVVLSRVFLGEPVSVVIREETVGDDLELKRFVAQQKAIWSYHAVQLTCSFASGEGESFDRAHVSVTLFTQSSSAAVGPIAWSMSPLKLAQKTEATQSASIGADLKFIKAEIKDETTVSENDLHLVAYNELRNDPYWRLKALPSVQIEGVQRLRMIVRVPFGIGAIGQLKVEADIRKQRFLLSCNAPVPDIPQLSFTL